MTNSQIYVSLNLFGQQRPTLHLVLIYSWFKRIGKKKLKLLLILPSVIKIFDELVKSGNIKVTRTLPPLDELKRCAYYKWHNSFSHATDDCIVFRQHIQSSINEGQLSF
jgi:hypothetical protein